jgi:hypothetical protein
VLGTGLTDRLVAIESPRDLARAIERELAASDEESAAVGVRLRERAADFDIGRLLAQIDGLYAEVGLTPARGRNGSPGG